MRIAKGFNFWSVTITLIAWFVIVLAISFTHFYASMNEQTEEHASTSLHDVSTGIAKIMETKIEGQWATLAPVARYAGEEEDMLNSEILIRIMDDMKDTTSFSVIFVADEQGNSINNSGVNVDVSTRYYYKTSMQGYNHISQILQNSITGEDVFVFSSPVYGNSGIQGVLGAAIRVKDFQELLDPSIFDGMGYVYIISGSGDVLVEPILEDQPINEQNVMTFIDRAENESNVTVRRLKEDMRLRQKGYLTFVTGGNAHNIYYMPLGINDWYIFCGVPQSYFAQQSSELDGIAFLLSVGILIALAPLILFLWIGERLRKADLLKRNKELQWNEERFRIAASLSDNIIFEADLVNNTMLFPNGFKNRMGYEPMTQDFPYAIVEAGHIHPDDAEAFIEMHTNIPPFTEKLSGEFRIKREGEDYIWHRIEEKLLTNEKGQAIRSIGSVLNIDDEKKALALLEARTQIECASGLYNKQATEIFIKKFLEEEPRGTHAMIVFDIDEFKSVNDSLGHVHGDQVISDLSDVLRNQFRATDILGRIGGDEFMVFLKNIPNELFVAAKIAKIRNIITKMHQVGVSAGIAIYPQDGTTYLELYNHADIAMYSVKKNGKNGFEFYVDIAKNNEDES